VCFTADYSLLLLLSLWHVHVGVSLFILLLLYFLPVVFDYIKLLYERSAWWDVGFSGSPLSCLLFSLYSALSCSKSYLRCLHLQAHLTLILHWRNNYNLDLKLFPHITQPRDYLRHFLPRLLHTALIKAHCLRKRQHYYQLPRVEYSQYKNSFINRYLFNFRWLY